MSSLSKLIAMNKAKQSGVPVSATPANNEPDGDATPERDATHVPTDTAELGSVPSTGSDDSSAPAAPAEPARTVGLAGKLNLLGKAKSGGNGGTTQRSVAAPAASATVPASESGVLGSAEFSLDDLAGFDESVAPAIEPRNETAFLDEIEATAPDRDLPADLESAQLMFVEQLDGIYQVLNDPEMFGQSVRVIMMELQENPEYIKLISDQDVHTMIAAMRNTMGLARIKKQAKSRKGTGTSARGKKAGAVSDDVMNLLDSLGGGDDE